MKPDALIYDGSGLIMTVRENGPEMPIHLSVQANTTNYWGVRNSGKTSALSAIILSRELSMEEIAEIRQECPRHRTFEVHSRRIVYRLSGCCLLSGYFNHRDQPRHLHQLLPLGTARFTTPLKAMQATPNFCKVSTLKKAQEEANQNFEGINGQKTPSLRRQSFPD